MLDAMTRPIETVSPEALGMSGERLARIDRFLAERYVDTGALPFASLLIARDGAIVHRAVLGQASLETGTPARPDTIARIYSMTKPVTSVALMMLVEQGLLMLDDPVEKHVPAFRRARVYRGGGEGGFETEPLAEPVRVIDLLRHTSGLTYGFQGRTVVDAAYRARGIDPIAWTGDLDSFVEALVDVPLEFQPATAWNCGVSTDVVGHLVEVLSGEPLAQFFAERIFAPLGMHDTGFHVAEASRDRLAGCYARDASGRLAPHHLRDFTVPPTAPSGGGGLVSTADDTLRFCEMVRRGGALDGARLLGPKTVAFMLQNHLPGGGDLHAMSVAMFSEGIYRGVGFGLGFAVVGDPIATGLAGSKGEAYWGGLASTSFWIDPVEGLSVVFLTQLIPSSSTTVRRELRQLVNAAIVESRARI